MIRLQDSRRVQWKDGERHYVGKVQMASDSGVQVRIGTWNLFVKCEPLGVIAIVPEDCLQPYPADPIPEPTNTGRTD